MRAAAAAKQQADEASNKAQAERQKREAEANQKAAADAAACHWPMKALVRLAYCSKAWL